MSAMMAFMVKTASTKIRAFWNQAFAKIMGNVRPIRMEDLNAIVLNHLQALIANMSQILNALWNLVDQMEGALMGLTMYSSANAKLDLQGQSATLRIKRAVTLRVFTVASAS